MPGPRLTRHADDRCRRGINFQTTTAAAGTRDAAEWIDTHVSNLCRWIIHSAPKLSLQNDAAPNSGPQRHTDNRAPSASGSLPHLTHRGGVGVVLKNRGPAQFPGQSIGDPKSIKTGQVRRSYDHAAFTIPISGT